MLALHICAAVSALLLGALGLASPKGTHRHKIFGRVWVGLMLAAAISSFWIFEIRKGAGRPLFTCFRSGP